MSWIRSSESALLVVLVAVTLLTAGTAAAISVSGSPPGAAAVGEQVSMEASLEDPFQDAPDQWTLEGSTDLENATWTVQILAQGDPVDTVDAGGQSFSYELNASTSATDVEIQLDGTVPGEIEYDYENLDTENYSVMTITRESDGVGNEIQSWDVHRFTEGSQNARDAIDNAIEAVGGQNDKINQAISSYNNGNFENAQALAEEAQSGAQSSQLLLMIAGVVVALAILVGVIYYWRQRRKQGDKLQ